MQHGLINVDISDCYCNVNLIGFLADPPNPVRGEGTNEGTIPAIMGKLTIRGVKTANLGRHADGQGLYLLVKPTGGRSWLLRVQYLGRRRDVGLGSVDYTARRLGANELQPRGQDYLDWIDGAYCRLKSVAKGSGDDAGRSRSKVAHHFREHLGSGLQARKHQSMPR